MFSVESIYNVIMTIITAVIGFFVKRTIGELDETRRELAAVKLEYTTKEEFRELDRKIDGITEQLHQVERRSISKEDFFQSMSALDRKMERLSEKLDERMAK